MYLGGVNLEDIYLKFGLIFVKLVSDCKKVMIFKGTRMQLTLKIISLFLFVSCADLSESGSRVRFIEHNGGLAEIQDLADKLTAKNDCRFIGFVDSNTSLFPGSYSTHENEIHAALRNRAAKMGANLIIANFYRKPAQGIGMSCPEEFLNQ
jgi:hypothetical protein